MGNRPLGTFQLFHFLSLLLLPLFLLHFEGIEPGEIPSRLSVLESATEIVYSFSVRVVLWLLVLASWVVHAIKADPIKVGTDVFVAGRTISFLKSREQ
jgi:hypothetical protein